MTFAKDLDITKDLSVEVRSQVRKLALKIDARVVMATPVDTGRARANWQVGLNRSPNEQLPTPDNAGSAAAVAIANAEKLINQAEPYGELYINNNLEYINRLNEGYSAQAPSNYVDIIIEQEVARNE